MTRVYVVSLFLVQVCFYYTPNSYHHCIHLPTVSGRVCVGLHPRNQRRQIRDIDIATGDVFGQYDVGKRTPCSRALGSVITCHSIVDVPNRFPHGTEPEMAVWFSYPR